MAFGMEMGWKAQVSTFGMGWEAQADWPGLESPRGPPKSCGWWALSSEFCRQEE